METHTLPPETAPGWRELVESLHEEIEAARTREQAAHAHQLFLERLLAEERLELQRLRGTGRSRPASARPLHGRSPRQIQILEALASQPGGLTRAQGEAAVGTTEPLGDVLIGMCRRGHLTRLGKGLYALPPGHDETSRPV